MPLAADLEDTYAFDLRRPNTGGRRWLCSQWGRSPPAPGAHAEWPLKPATLRPRRIATAPTGSAAQRPPRSSPYVN